MSKKKDIPVTHAPSGPSPHAPTGWSGFGSLREEMEKLFDTFEPRLWFDRGMTPAGRIPGPAIDLCENGKGYVVTAENVSVKVSNGTLTISGEKSEDAQREEDTYHLRERRWGSFQRVLRLPDDVDRDRIEARCEKGVLTVTLPKSEAALASERTVEVTAA